jgi:ribonuclease BN (tRNA processing enzyme)
MNIRVLGCSGGIGAELRTTSLLLGEEILIDAGTGICELSLEQLRRIRHIFVTHSHLDHITGIPLLVDTIFDTLETPLTVHGRRETLRALREHVFNDVIWPDFNRIPNHSAPVLRYQEMVPGEQRTIGECTLEMIPVNHAVPAAGYRLTCGEGTLAFSGDTTTNDEFWGALNRHPGLDVLVVEAAFPNRDLELSRLAQHYCPSLLSADLLKLKHRPRVYITHLKPGAEQEIMEECRAAISGLEVVQLTGGETFSL